MNVSESSKNAAWLAEKIQNTLNANKIVVVRQEIIIAGSDSENAGQSLKSWKQSNNNYLEIPFEELESAKVLLSFSSDSYPSIHIAEKIIAYLVENIKVDNLEQQQLINQILENRHDEAEILKQAKSLGLDLSIPRAVILIDAGDDLQTEAVEGATTANPKISYLIMTEVAQYFGSVADPICLEIDRARIAAFKICNSASLSQWTDEQDTIFNSSLANLNRFRRAADGLLEFLQNNVKDRRIRVSLGRYYSGLTGLKKSYQEAEIALQLGRYFSHSAQAYCIDRLGIAGLIQIGDRQTKLDLAQSILAPLDHEPVLLETVEAFLNSNCSPVAASKQLSVHRNTLRYRLDKIHALIGLDPRQFDDAVQIRLAMELRQLEQSQSVEL